MLRRALLIAAVDLRRRLRNRTVLFYCLVGPLLLSGIISLAFSGGDDFEATIAVVDEDHSPVAAALVASLTASDDEHLRFRTAASVVEAERLLDDDGIGAAIVLPSGFGAAVTTGSPVRLVVLTGANDPIVGNVAESVAEGIVARIETGRLVVAAAATLEQPVAFIDPAALTPALALGTRESVASFDPASYFAPSMAIFFLFFTVALGARSLLAERSDGTLARMRSTPTTDAAIIGGKTLSTIVLGLMSLFAVYAISSALFGAQWGPALGVSLVIVVTVLAVAGIGSLVTGIARTESQADGLSSMITFVFAVAGGNFISPGDMPAALRLTALFTPNGWALRALTELSAGDGALSDIAMALAVLTAIAVISAGVGIVGLQRRIAQ